MKREGALGQRQEKGAERWSDMGAAEEFWSVGVSVLLPGAGCSCVSGWSCGFGPRGWADGGKSGEVTCSRRENYGSSGSFCSAGTDGRRSGCDGPPASL